MILEPVPLLQVARDLYAQPRGYGRFRQYLRVLIGADRNDPELAPLIAMNPMAREHVAERIEEFLALGAEAIAARAVEEARPVVADLPGEVFRVGLVVVDDLRGGWTSRPAIEFRLRFGDPLGPRPARDVKWRKWISAVLWASEPASAEAVRAAVAAPIHRLAYGFRHGRATTLRQRLAQEGRVLADAGCLGPTLDPEDLEYTRTVLAPLLDETDDRTSMECLFGDAPCRPLGFTPRGLSPWAGLALALHDARTAAARGP